MSAQTVEDPFGLDTDEEFPKRDHWQRPLLVPLKGGEREPFTRMSTLADMIADNTALSVWQKWLLAQGLAYREDIAAMVAALPALNDAKIHKSFLSKEQRLQDKDTKAKLNSYIDMALEAAGCHYKANQGTARHGFIEQGDTACAPEAVKADVETCLERFQRDGIEILASEVFVVNDELQCAGSFDHLAYVPALSGVAIIDIKTGSVDGKGLAFATQIAGYANSVVYDPYTDQRTPLESLTGGQLVNRREGLIVHVPLGGTRTDLYRVNLTMGLRSARLAVQVRNARKAPGFMSLLEDNA